MKLIQTCLLIFLVTPCLLAQETKDFFRGDWRTEPDENGMVDIISLKKHGIGITGPARINDGSIEFAPYLSSNLKNWTLEGDTLILTTAPIPIDNKGNTKSMTLRYIILEKGENSFVAIYSDPEMDKMMEETGEKMEPIKLTFKKME